MKFSPSPRSQPLRFLLYLEWGLLLVMAVIESLPFSPLQMPRLPLLNLVGLGVFAVMGVRLPTQRLGKVIHISLSLGLILALSLVGGIRLFQFFYVVLVIRNCLIFEGWYCSAVTAIAFLLCVLTQAQRFRYATLSPLLGAERLGIIWFSIALLVGLVLLFLQLLVNALLAERKSQRKLAVANDQLRHYALRIEDLATLQERNRIARDIHDSLGHSLTAFNLHLEAALRLLQSDPDEARDLLVEAKQLGSTALQSVRQSVGALRSDPLQGRSLEAAIAALVEDFHRSTNILPCCKFAIASSLANDTKTAAYRIVQEALTNICKYANATEVTIDIQTTPALQLIVQDNGNGFDLNQNTTGFGIQGMRERAIALNGSFAIVTEPNKGCRVMATFP